MGKRIKTKIFLKLSNWDRWSPTVIVVNIKLNNLIVVIIDSVILIEYKIDIAAQTPNTINITNGLFEVIDFMIFTPGFLERKKIMLSKLTIFKYNQWVAILSTEPKLGINPTTR